MWPVLRASGAVATYQKMSALLHILRQPALGSGLVSGRHRLLPHSRVAAWGLHHVSSFSSLRKMSAAVVATLENSSVNVSRRKLASCQAYCPLWSSRRPVYLCAAQGQREIPDYLHGSISEVDTAEDDLLEDGLDEVLCNDMEDDIIDFLTPRLIPYEETDSSFILPCPACSEDGEDARMQEIFVDKNSGYFVCPWCCRDGSWEDLMALLTSREDCLSPQQLQAYLATTTPISEVADSLLHESPLREVSRVVLDKFGARVSSDESRVVLPVTSLHGEVVGLESVSLLHPLPQIIRRFVTGQSRAFSQPGSISSSREQRVIVVPTCCDVLTLAEQNTHAIALPINDVVALESYLVESGRNEVLLWCRGLPPPRPLLLSLIQAGVSCSLVESAENDSPIHRKSSGEVQSALKRTIPVLSPATTTFHQIKDKVYHRLTHKEETCGTQWKRFSGLNDLLLGHRPGEMTVLTGPTGSGKTTLMAEYSLDLCCQGVRTLWGSFEVSVVRLCEVMLQQYSGAPLPQDLPSFNTVAAQFSMLPLHFLTYHGQQSVAAVIKAMTEAVQVWGVQHAVIDNLQFMLGSSENTSDRWWEQDRAVAAFRRFATLTGCHLTLIAHPKKVPEGQPLGIGSVFGSAKVTQEADNVLILQVKEGSTFMQSRKVLQVVKNRYGGQLGEMPLKFHKDSLTLSSCFRQKSRERRVGGEQTSKTTALRRLDVKGLSAIDT